MAIRFCFIQYIYHESTTVIYKSQDYYFINSKKTIKLISNSLFLILFLNEQSTTAIAIYSLEESKNNSFKWKLCSYGLNKLLRLVQKRATRMITLELKRVFGKTRDTWLVGCQNKDAKAISCNIELSNDFFRSATAIKQYRRHKHTIRPVSRLATIALCAKKLSTQPKFRPELEQTASASWLSTNTENPPKPGIITQAQRALLLTPFTATINSYFFLNIWIIFSLCFCSFFWNQFK